MIFVFLPLPICFLRSTCCLSLFWEGIKGATWNMMSISFHFDAYVCLPDSPAIQQSLVKAHHSIIMTYFWYPDQLHTRYNLSIRLFGPLNLKTLANHSIIQYSKTMLPLLFDYLLL